VISKAALINFIERPIQSATNYWVCRHIMQPDCPWKTRVPKVWFLSKLYCTYFKHVSIRRD